MRVHRTEEKNSTRHEIRTVRVQPLAKDQVRFPHATQALLIERDTTGRGGFCCASGPVLGAVGPVLKCLRLAHPGTVSEQGEGPHTE
ncbi:hypothetical protein ABZS71_02505 [Streptomyces sp. NPDC005393]|uniref:hypothetical protein n=1 Tax=Streptomyces sp. NPDC005393 TaxID=3157041 RepID=UPI0033BDED02